MIKSLESVDDKNQKDEDVESTLYGEDEEGGEEDDEEGVEEGVEEEQEGEES